MELDSDKFPSLFKKEEKGNHPLYFQDESGTSCLREAIKDGQIDICKMIIDEIDLFTLKQGHVSPNKSALKFIEDIKQNHIKQNQYDNHEVEQLQRYIENKLGKKESKKERKQKNKKNKQVNDNQDTLETSQIEDTEDLLPGGLLSDFKV